MLRRAPATASNVRPSHPPTPLLPHCGQKGGERENPQPPNPPSPAQRAEGGAKEPRWKHMPFGIIPVNERAVSLERPTNGSAPLSILRA